MTTVIDSTKEYQWSQNWPQSIAHTDIKKVVLELKDIEDSRGEIKPEYVVESSKNKKSVLYGYFEWDNEKAANSWRLLQAKNLLRHIEVRVVSNGEPKFVRVYETISRSYGNSQPLYKNVDTIDNESRRKAIGIIVSDLKGIKTRLLRFEILPKIISHIEKAIEELSKESTETINEVGTESKAV